MTRRPQTTRNYEGHTQTRVEITNNTMKCKQINLKGS